MFGGAYYIWIMAAFFLLLVLVIGGMTLALWVGHLIEKKETGARHGFLELPEELREKGNTEGTEGHGEGEEKNGEGAADERGWGIWGRD